MKIFKLFLGAESKGIIYMGLDTVGRDDKIKLGQLEKLRMTRFNKRTQEVRETSIQYDGNLRDAKTAEVLYFEKTGTDTLCLEMFELEQDGHVIRLIQDYEFKR